MRRSPLASTRDARWCGNGANASSKTAWTACPSAPGEGDRGFSPPEVIVEVKAIACELPAVVGLPLSRLSTSDIRGEVIRQGVVAQISETTIWRWLSEDAIRPWTYRSWIFPRDPDFEAKAGRVLDLYQHRWGGRRLSPDEYVISADEKTRIQARCRCHPTLPPGVARTMRVEHEYERGGALDYIAALDVHRMKLFGRCEDQTTIKSFDRLVAQVMRREPYRSARRVFLIVDNDSAHRGPHSVERLEGRYPNLRVVHVPIHSSWLNQIEIYFSVVQRKVLTPNDFTDLGEVEGRLLAFQRRYEKIASPFEWKFTKKDLADLLRRLDERDEALAA
jgi:hypothetical protein